MYNTYNAPGRDVLLLALTSYANTSSPILYKGVLNFFPNIICLGDSTECTPDFLLNDLISIVARVVISIVSLLEYFVDCVSDCIDLSLSFTNLIAFSTLGTYKSAAHVTKSMCSSLPVHLVRCSKAPSPKADMTLNILAW